MKIIIILKSFKILQKKEEKMQNDLYLSDIYIENESSIIKSQTNTSIKNLYRFEFSVPLQTTEHPTSAATTDADGDLVVHRLQTNKHTFHIESELKTSLVDVGLQLWRASFFLADFLIHNSSLIRDESVLDLGAGLGITSLVASLFAKHVYCTDLDHVVKYASMNYRRNAEVIKEINPNSCVDFKCKVTDFQIKKYIFREHWITRNYFCLLSRSRLGELP